MQQVKDLEKERHKLGDGNECTTKIVGRVFIMSKPVVESDDRIREKRGRQRGRRRRRGRERRMERERDWEKKRERGRRNGEERERRKKKREQEEE